MESGFDLSGRHEGGVAERFVRVVEVVADSVYRGSACLEKPCEFQVRRTAIFTCCCVNELNENSVLPDRFCWLSSGDFEGALFHDRLANPPDQLRATPKLLFHLVLGHLLLGVSCQKEIQGKHFLSALDVLKKFRIQTRPVNILEPRVGIASKESCEVEEAAAIA